MNTSKKHIDIVLPLKLDIMDISTIRQNMSGIYKITCPDGCIYIGQSNDIKKRLWGYKRVNKSKNKIHNSIDEKGIKNHSFEIIHLIDESLPFDKLKEILNELEINYIKDYNCFDTTNGLNSTSGGSSKSKMSKETRQKLSDSHKGQVAWNKGGKISEETKAKISGKNSHMTGKFGELNHNYGRKPTEEQKKAQSEKMMGRNKGKPFSGTRMEYTEENRVKLRKPKPPRTEEHRKNIGLSKKGKKLTKEHVDKVFAWRQDEEKAQAVAKKISISNTGKKLSPESIAKREATRKRNRELIEEEKRMMIF